MTATAPPRIRLTSYARCAGCAAKLGPAALTLALGDVPTHHDPRLLVGRESFDDAGVFRAHDDLALVQTVDFFAPIVDDPYEFGQVAAANALSDVYAMGGEPLTALAIVGFPSATLPLSVLTAIVAGGRTRCGRPARCSWAGTPSSTRSSSSGSASRGRRTPATCSPTPPRRPGTSSCSPSPSAPGCSPPRRSKIAWAGPLTRRWGRACAPSTAAPPDLALALDPQTSGGLLVAVPPSRVAEYLSRVPGSVVVGVVAPRQDAFIVLD